MAAARFVIIVWWWCFLGITTYSMQCHESTAGGECVRVSADCVWCSPNLPTGNFCLNLTTANVTNSSACPPCVHYTDPDNCGSAYDASAALCIWCNISVRFGPYCTRPGRINDHCGSCEVFNDESMQCMNPIDGLGRICNVQCSSSSTALAVACSSQPSNCSGCSSIQQREVCYGNYACVWCSVHQEGPYCVRRGQPDPHCSCNANNAFDCQNHYTPFGQYCTWCAPSNAVGSFCVDPSNAPYWCQEFCENANTRDACDAAGGSTCEWCGGEMTNGYYCGVYGNNPNCTFVCTDFVTQADCVRVGCRWCAEGLSTGPYCREFLRYCPSCSTYTTATACEAVDPLPHQRNVDPTPCLWCRAANRATGHLCTSFYAVDSRCASCQLYENSTLCNNAVSPHHGPCRWCNANAATGDFCLGTDNSDSNPVCPSCNSYSSVSACVASTDPTGTACEWCDASHVEGDLCTSSASPQCPTACNTYLNGTLCVASFDAYGPCRWCNSSTLLGPYCSSLHRSTCTPCNTYASFETCMSSFDAMGQCHWCDANSCVGLATFNPLCTCSQAAKVGMCQASRNSHTHAPCYWCDLNFECYDNASSCVKFACSDFFDVNSCPTFNCQWCGSVCQSIDTVCPRCNTITIQSQCPISFSPFSDVPSCFLCSPTSPTSACASMYPSDADPSSCPACATHSTKADCEASFAAYNASCRWCDVSYSCVPPWTSCEDCFSFLIPGNRLNPYWTTLVTVLKDYFVLLLAVLLVPPVKHGWRRAKSRVTKGPGAVAHVTVYVAQDTILNAEGDGIGTLTSSVDHFMDENTGADDPCAVVQHFIDRGEVWIPRDLSLQTASIAALYIPDDANDDGRSTVVAGHWCVATFVASRHLLQRSAYAAVLPPNVLVLLLNVAFAIGYLVFTGLKTNDAFAQRRHADAAVFGWDMYFVVLGYRVVNSGMQPTAALTLWQLMAGLIAAKVEGPRKALSRYDMVHMLSEWGTLKKGLAAAQLLLLVPFWALSVMGVAAYAWVFVLPVIVTAALIVLLRRLALQLVGGFDGTQSLLAANGENPSAAAAAAADPASPIRFKLQPTTALFVLAQFPVLTSLRRVAVALTTFLGERALPVVVLSTVLQTGYNYSTLYLFAPHHKYASYVGVVAMEYNARSNICLIQEVNDIVGEAAATVLSYVLPFA